MNIDYILYHVATELRTIVRTWEGPLAIDTQPTLVSARQDLEDQYLSFPAFLEYAAQFPTAQHDPARCPLLFTVGSGLIYAYTASPACSALIGPIRLDANTPLNLHGPEIEVSAQQLALVFTCNLHAVTAQVLLISNLFRKDWLCHDDLVSANCIAGNVDVTVRQDYARLVFERQELNEPHNPYEQELREGEAVSQGDVEMLRRSINEVYAGSLGRLADDDLRHMKNICIVVITLASRAAIRGGLNPEQAYSLSDVYIQSIEKMTDPNMVFSMTRQYEMEYTRLVAEVRAGRANSDKRPNMWTEQCKDYIFQHLHEKITTRDVAEHLHLNANYLSEIFHQCENMTITDFIMGEKVKLTRNLLTYSPYSYIEIATYLGFSSQSHLGKVFKRFTGMTLRQYRERYGNGSPAAALAEGERLAAEGKPWTASSAAPVGETTSW